MGLVFNLAQRSTSAHPRCAALMREAMQGDPDGLLASFELCLMHILAADKARTPLRRLRARAPPLLTGAQCLPRMPFERPLGSQLRPPLTLCSVDVNRAC